MHERLENFLKSKGLTESDIKKVLFYFVIAKYVTGCAWFVVGVKYVFLF